MCIYIDHILQALLRCPSVLQDQLQAESGVNSDSLGPCPDGITSPETWAVWEFILLMIEILHDFLFPNPRNYGSIALFETY